MGNVYGYVRVSTKDQNEDRQLIALQEMSIPETMEVRNLPWLQLSQEPQ